MTILRTIRYATREDGLARRNQLYKGDVGYEEAPFEEYQFASQEDYNEWLRHFSSPSKQMSLFPDE